MSVQQTYRSPGPAKGVVRGHAPHRLVRVAVGFPRETFDVINALAAHNGVSFSEAARQLIDEALASDAIAKRVVNGKSRAA